MWQKEKGGREREQNKEENHRQFFKSFFKALLRTHGSEFESIFLEGSIFPGSLTVPSISRLILTPSTLASKVLCVRVSIWNFIFTLPKHNGID